MIVAAVISGPDVVGMRSLSTISARARSTGWRLRLANAVTRISAPSSSRMFVAILQAMYSRTSSGAPQPLLRGLLAQDGDAGLEVGRLDVGDEAPLEPGAHPVLERGQLLGRQVAR